MHNEGDMKYDAGAPATKGDLERFAAKTDLELLAIRADLERFATKTEVIGVTTRIDRMELVLKNVAVEVSGIKSELTDMRQDFSAALTRTESRLINHLDGFMAKTLKVERDEVWLIHRVDKLEDRVTRIEKKSP